MNPSDICPVAPRHFDHLDPWLIHISSNFGIRWYGLAYLAGILIAALVFMHWAFAIFPEAEIEVRRARKSGIDRTAGL